MGLLRLVSFVSFIACLATVGFWAGSYRWALSTEINFEGTAYDLACRRGLISLSTEPQFKHDMQDWLMEREMLEDRLRKTTTLYNACRSQEIYWFGTRSYYDTRDL